MRSARSGRQANQNAVCNDRNDRSRRAHLGRVVQVFQRHADHGLAGRMALRQAAALHGAAAPDLAARRGHQIHANARPTGEQTQQGSGGLIE